MPARNSGRIRWRTVTSRSLATPGKPQPGRLGRLTRPEVVGEGRRVRPFPRGGGTGPPSLLGRRAPARAPAKTSWWWFAAAVRADERDEQAGRTVRGPATASASLRW